MNILVLEDSIFRCREFRRQLPSAELYTTADELIACLDKADAVWDMLFLDHDLGNEVYVDPAEHNTGSEVVRWIVLHRPKIKKIIVHSLNTEAAKYMVHDLSQAGYDAQHIHFFNLPWADFAVSEAQAQTE